MGQEIGDAVFSDEAFAELEALAGETLDRECVEALLSRRDEVEEMRRIDDPLPLYCLVARKYYCHLEIFEH